MVNKNLADDVLRLYGAYKISGDISFSFNKCVYHQKRFKEEFAKTCNHLKEHFRVEAIEKIKFIQELKWDKQHSTEAIFQFSSELDNECFFEFDSLMQEIKRCIEYRINTIILKFEFDNSKKGIESFFNSLNPNLKSERRNICKLIIREKPQLANYLWEQWISWIKDLNDYRTLTVHYYIPNKLEGEVTVHWNIMANPDSPTEVKLKGIFIKNKRIDDYVDNLITNLNNLIVNCHEFLTN